jgi:segregation and condensation protein B
MKEVQLHIEALIFASEQSITILEIESCISSVFHKYTFVPYNEIIEAIKLKYKSDEYPFELVFINGGYQFLTKKIYIITINHIIQQRNKKKLSVAAMETLSIIAYKQPVTRSEIEQIRGVNSDYSVHKLLDKELVTIAGKSNLPGRPLLYETSKLFMDYFGLASLKDLPQLKDIQIVESNEIGIKSEI